MTQIRTRKRAQKRIKRLRKRRARKFVLYGAVLGCVTGALTLGQATWLGPSAKSTKDKISRVKTLQQLKKFENELEGQLSQAGVQSSFDPMCEDQAVRGAVEECRVRHNKNKPGLRSQGVGSPGEESHLRHSFQSPRR